MAHAANCAPHSAGCRLQKHKNTGQTTENSQTKAAVVKYLLGTCWRGNKPPGNIPAPAVVAHCKRAYSVRLRYTWHSSTFFCTVWKEPGQSSSDHFMNNLLPDAAARKKTPQTCTAYAHKINHA
jgi:hypothetical protein